MSSNGREDVDSSLDSEVISRPAAETGGQEDDGKLSIKFKDWGFNVDRLFEVSYRFYKRNESKAFHPSFDVRNQMNALVLQIRYGNYDNIKAPDVGTLDLVGKSRRHQWSLLRGMSKVEAMSKFICTLDEICPIFKAYAEAVKLSSDNINQQNREHSQDENAVHRSQGPSYGLQQTHIETEKDEQRRAIKKSLARQTFSQFKAYAAKEHPNDTSSQSKLIDSLQEQYYLQYIAKMHPDLCQNVQSQEPQASPSNNSTNNVTALDTISLGSFSNEPMRSIDGQDNERLTDSQPNKIVTSTDNDTNVQNIEKSSNITYHSPTTNGPERSTLPSSYCPEPPSDPTSSHLTALPSMSDHNEVRLKGSKKDSIGNDRNEVSNNGRPNELIKQYEYREPHNIGTYEPYPAPKLITKAQIQSSINIVDVNSVNQPRPEATGNHERNFNSAILPDPVNLVAPPPVLPPTIQSDAPILPQINKDTCPIQLPEPTLELPPPPSPMCTTFFNTAPSNHLTDSRLETNAQQEDLYSGLADQSSDALTMAQAGARVLATWDSSSSSGQGSPEPRVEAIDFKGLQIEPASMWTKKGAKLLMSMDVDDKLGGSYTVRGGTVVTLQVPTYHDGRSIYWEFATDDYDIGFGVDFVFEAEMENPPRMRIHEGTDEDELEEGEQVLEELASEEELYNSRSQTNDLESYAAGMEARQEVVYKRQLLEARRKEIIRRLANTVTIVPTYRRDSHEEVQIGRHKYPGQGYYLLKFDNTYSVWREKKLTYRICYFC